MDATTMPSMQSIVRSAREHYPHFSFEEAPQFSWSPDKKTVFYNEAEGNAPYLFLHELSHALLGHRTYSRDVELLAMEVDAWEKAKTLKELADISIPEEVIEDHLDTYRDWLHARSTCPACSSNGYQIERARYECPACRHTWHVNEARLCALRRYSDT